MLQNFFLQDFAIKNYLSLRETPQLKVKFGNSDLKNLNKIVDCVAKFNNTNKSFNVEFYVYKDCGMNVI